MTDFEKLKQPFASHDIDWLLVGVFKKGSVISARCLAYVTNRAVMERLDLACGPDGWKNEYKEGPDGGVLCGISVRCNDGWLTRWDGAENTDISPVKGGLSGAMKRAAAQFGVGRYLYYLPEGWAIVNSSGRFYANRKVKIKNKTDKEWVTFHWDPPGLPDWALPGGTTKPPPEQINTETGEVASTQMGCPVCDSPIFDRRAEKDKGSFGQNFPDLSCSNSKCEWAVWMETWQNDLLHELEACHDAELIDAKERDNAEKIVHGGDVALMVRIAARMNELANAS